MSWIQDLANESMQEQSHPDNSAVEILKWLTDLGQDILVTLIGADKKLCAFSVFWEDELLTEDLKGWII